MGRCTRCSCSLTTSSWRTEAASRPRPSRLAPSFRCRLSRCSPCARLRSAPATRPPRGSARCARWAASCWRAASAPPSSTTLRRACPKRRCPPLSQPRRASRGLARRASRRASLPSSGRCSSQPASGQQAQRRSLGRRGRRGARALNCGGLLPRCSSVALMQEGWLLVGLRRRLC